MEGSEYYESLIQQGYSSEQAEQHTAQHYPGFTAQKQMPVIQDSVVGGNLHSGDVIHHHHHAAPVVLVRDDFLLAERGHYSGILKFNFNSFEKNDSFS